MSEQNGAAIAKTAEHVVQEMKEAVDLILKSIARLDALGLAMPMVAGETQDSTDYMLIGALSMVYLSRLHRESENLKRLLHKQPVVRRDEELDVMRDFAGTYGNPARREVEKSYGLEDGLLGDLFDAIAEVEAQLGMRQYGDLPAA